MLNEIFKGMDNAAEVINDNFESVKIKQGQNENGSYVMLGNGLKIAWFSMGAHISDTYQWDYPIEFSSPPVVLATSTRTADLNGGVTFGVSPYADYARLVKWGGGGLNHPFNFIAVGY